MSPAKQYFRAAEIASLTGISLRTIRRWIRDKVLRSTKAGGARLVAITDLEAVLSGYDDTARTSDNQEENDEDLDNVGKASYKNTFQVWYK